MLCAILFILYYTVIKKNYFKWEKNTSSLHFLLSEDEQRNTLNFQKELHALTVEKEAALADLNSVERSLSDVFRRYENMKSTLEGFKKVSNIGTRSW